jgi:hypothetical protein
LIKSDQNLDASKSSKPVRYLKWELEDWMEFLLENDQESFDSCVELLDRVAIENCKYSTHGLGTERISGLENNQNLLITSRPENESITSKEEFKRNFKGFKGKWKNALNSGDSKRIACIKLRGNFPANAIGDLPIWKNKYKVSNYEDSVQYHIDKRLVNAPDLFPEPFAKNAPAYFGLGAALGYIYCDGGSGYKIDTKNGSKNLFNGGRNKTDRLRAFNYFKESIDFIKEIKARYEAEKRRDPQGIKEKLFKHFDILNLEIDRTHPEFENRRVYFAKLVDGIKHAEKDFIELERKSTANFVLTDGVMVTSDYHRKVRQADGTDVETYPIFELQKAGLEV